jgi:glucose-1-phosphate thymidylyltransferase
LASGYTDMKCLILASGFGTRLYPLTEHQAKALLPYKGKPMINHIADKIPADVDILVNVNKKFAADFQTWQKRQNRKIDICVEDVSSEEERLGAVGALHHWIREKGIREDLMVFGSDNYFEFDLAKFISVFDGRHVLVAIYDVLEKGNARQYGVVRIEGNRIIELEEKPAFPKSSLIATACWILPAGVFPLISEFCQGVRKDNLGNLITYLIEKENVLAYPFKEKWIDIGNLEIYNATK